LSLDPLLEIERLRGRVRRLRRWATGASVACAFFGCLYLQQYVLNYWTGLQLYDLRQEAAQTRTELENDQAKAEELREQALDQRRRAEANFIAARRVVDEFAKAASEQEDEPSLQAVRRRLLEEAAKAKQPD
jgi:hypothetical protein